MKELKELENKVDYLEQQLANTNECFVNLMGILLKHQKYRDTKEHIFTLQQSWVEAHNDIFYNSNF